MKFKFSLIFTFFLVVSSFSQESKKVLFTIDNDPFYTDEFLAVYNKNKPIISDATENDLENSLQLFVDYKLKVRSAKELKLDTLQKFKDELKQYKNSLILPYLKDESVTDKLVEEAYDRLQKEINVSHILILVKSDATPKDTLDAYNKIVEARNLILAGEEFSTIAKQYSQDPSGKKTGGNLGYFSVLQMVYPFENVAYSTEKGAVSEPFKTRFGYHILKVNDIRKSKGEVEVAHIMIKNTSDVSKKKIDSIYGLLLKKPTDFGVLAKEFSEDKSSARNGGRLKRFNASRMIESFSDVAFSLNSENEISKPFKTQYGWHIVKLIKKYPIQSFEIEAPKLKSKVEKDGRSNLIGKAVIERLFKEYKIVVNKEALQQFEVDDWRNNPEKFQQKLLQIENKEIYQSAFIKFLKTTKKAPINTLFKTFEEKEVLNYYKDNIQFSNKEFAAIYKEFEEGMLLFEMLETKVWNKSKDSVGISDFYNANKIKKYANKKLDDYRGLVISDYQKYLEEMWIDELHKKYKVKFNKPEKAAVLKQN